MASITSSIGLGSGIDINGLVTKLVDAERVPVTKRLDRQEADVQAKITAMGTFKASLADFRSSLTGLKDASSFLKVTATSSDDSIVSASATSNADVGNYRMEVKQLSQSHALASTSFNSTSASLGTGVLTIKFGTDPTNSAFVQNADKGTLTLTIDSSNNTLTGVRDAINKANAGISAAVVNNGAGYQLVLNSTDGGVKNAMQVSGLAALSYNASVANNTMTQTQVAQDAKISLNGLEVTSASNTFTNTLKGLTINAKKAQPGTLVDLAVGQSNDDLVKGVSAFVKGYNDFLGAVKEVASYNPATKTGGPLLGDAAVQGATSMLRSELSRFVQGLTGSYRSLGDIGVRVQKDGTLNLDNKQLTTALTANRDAVAAVFSVIGRPTDPAVKYLDASADTRAGSFAVNISQAATQGKLQGQQALTFPVTISATNKTFKLNVDSVSSGDITLTEGNYADSTALIAEIQSRINGDGPLKAKGVSVAVSLDGSNNLLMTSRSYGSASKLSVSQGNAALGLTVGLGGTDGLDVVGTIGGNAAEGSGQQLTGTTGAATGLKLLIEDNQTGDRGGVTFSRGLMERLDKVMGSLLESKGSIGARLEGLDKTQKKIDKDRSNLDDRMNLYQKTLLKKFITMDSLVGSLQSTGSYLTQQLANMPYSNSSN